jgi:hypothetical protein
VRPNELPIRCRRGTQTRKIAPIPTPQAVTLDGRVGRLPVDCLSDTRTPLAVRDDLVYRVR